MGGVLREEAAEEEVEGLEVVFEGFVVGGGEVDEGPVVVGCERGDDGRVGGAPACGEMIFLVGVVVL